MPTRAKVNSDRSYVLTINRPPATYFLKQAAGVQKGAMEPSMLCALFYTNFLPSMSSAVLQLPLSQQLYIL